MQAEPIDPVKLVIRLLIIEAEHDKKIEKAANLGIDLADYFEVNCIGIVLDILGVPEDNYNADTKKGYCRDWDYGECAKFIKGLNGNRGQTEGDIIRYARNHLNLNSYR